MKIPVKNPPKTKISQTLAPELNTDILSLRIAKLCMLGALVWDYTDTILDIVSQQRLSATKQLSRAVRLLRRDYDANQRFKLPPLLITRQRELAEQFEEICSEHFDKFYFGVGYERKVSDLNPDSKMLVKAVMAAITVLDALLAYAKESDLWLANQGEHRYTVLSPCFRTLSKLLPEFAGDSLPANSQWRTHTAKILFNELHFTDLYDKDGKLPSDE